MTSVQLWRFSFRFCQTRVPKVSFPQSPIWSPCVLERPRTATRAFELSRSSKVENHSSWSTLCRNSIRNPFKSVPVVGGRRVRANESALRRVEALTTHDSRARRPSLDAYFRGFSKKNLGARK